MLRFTWLIGLLTAGGIGIGLLLLHATLLGDLLHRHIPEPWHRRLLLATVSFGLTFTITRALTWCIHYQIGPFHDVHIGGRHIHHLVWGILGLLAIGFCWLLRVGEGGDELSLLTARFLSLSYGAAAALTLDEFALWLNLEDVYWSPKGRASIDAVIIFGSLLLAILIGMPLIKGVARDGLRT